MLSATFGEPNETKQALFIKAIEKFLLENQLLVIKRNQRNLDHFLLFFFFEIFPQIERNFFNYFERNEQKLARSICIVNPKCIFQAVILDFLRSSQF